MGRGHRRPGGTRAAPAKVQAASLRDAASIAALARHGVDCFTVNHAVAQQLFTDDLTAEADRAFDAAIAAMPVTQE